MFRKSNLRSLDPPNKKSPKRARIAFINGPDGTRTRDLLRDWQILHQSSIDYQRVTIDGTNFVTNRLTYLIWRENE